MPVVEGDCLGAVDGVVGNRSDALVEIRREVSVGVVGVFDRLVVAVEEVHRRLAVGVVGEVVDLEQPVTVEGDHEAVDRAVHRVDRSGEKPWRRAGGAAACQRRDVAVAVVGVCGDVRISVSRQYGSGVIDDAVVTLDEKSAPTSLSAWS